MDKVQINECFARDDLHYEESFVPTPTEVELLGTFADAGFRRTEATSYSPLRDVPAFRDAGKIPRDLPCRDGMTYKATCPNLRAVKGPWPIGRPGPARRRSASLPSASVSPSRTTDQEQWTKAEGTADLGAGAFRHVDVAPVAVGFPFEGRVGLFVVIDHVMRFRELGAVIFTIGVTTGLADLVTTKQLFGILFRENPDPQLVAHFHGTGELGVANAAAYETGCRHFDTAMGAIGGHPARIQYGVGQTRNIATEGILNLFQPLGVSTALNLDAVMSLSRRCEAVRGRELNSKVAGAGLSGPVLAGKAVA